MLEDLRWLGLDWDEGPGVEGPVGPYRQSERGPLYAEMAAKLMESGAAYPCFSTEEELNAKRAAVEAKGDNYVYDGAWRDADPAVVEEKLAANEPHVVRFKVQPGARVEIDDLVRGSVSWDAESTVGDFILLRSNGVPVYNFCVAVDDATMGITHVVRAEEHLTNTLRQGLVLEALGFKMPQVVASTLLLSVISFFLHAPRDFVMRICVTVPYPPTLFSIVCARISHPWRRPQQTLETTRRDKCRSVSRAGFPPRGNDQLPCGPRVE
jgi:glutamyl-tRNA synthetase